MNRITLLSVSLTAAMTLTGCSKILPKFDQVVPDNRKQYEKAQTLPDLEVPPDLSTEAIRDRMAIPEGGQAASYSSYQERRAEQQRADELEKTQNAAVRVLENEHVLAVEGATVQVWPKLESFWQTQGYALELDDVELGIIETAWVDSDDGLRRTKFKIFAEAGEQPGTTVLYVSEEAEELLPVGEDLVWQRRPRNEEQERAMVDNLLASLENRAGSSAGGVSVAKPIPLAEEVAPTAVAADSDSDNSAPLAAPALRNPDAMSAGPKHAELVSVGEGKVYLTVAEEFPQAWKSTGRALEKAGIEVKDSDKGRGVYLIAFKSDTGEQDAGSSGMWNKLKFWDKGDLTEYQVSLTGVGEKTEVVVLDRDGRWETNQQAGLVLDKLHDAFNSGHI